MMERRRRIVIWGVMLLLMIVFFMKGRGPDQKEGSVAFLHEKDRTVTVRLCGNIENPGVYSFRREANVGTVIKMTLPGYGLEKVDNRLLNRMLQDGDVVDFRSDNKQGIDITIKKMQAREMVVLGIPLDPNRLGVNDWDSLPGIGPALAVRIVQDRQNNGDFKSFQDLQRVPGIGEGKIRQLTGFF